MILLFIFLIIKCITNVVIIYSRRSNQSLLTGGSLGVSLISLVWKSVKENKSTFKTLMVYIPMSGFKDSLWIENETVSTQFEQGQFACLVIGHILLYSVICFLVYGLKSFDKIL